MGFGTWLQSNWFVLLQTVGVIGGLFFTGYSLLLNTRVRRVANLISLTTHHREIWSQLFSSSALSRILDPAADLKNRPVTQEEEIFVGFLILHLTSAFHAIQKGTLSPPEGLSRDIKEFFALPIPKAVWQRRRRLQDRAFVRFVSSIIQRRRRSG